MSANANVLIGLTAMLGKPAAAVGGTADNYAIATAFNFCIDGVTYTKGTVADGTTPIVDGNTGLAHNGIVAGQRVQLVWGVNAAGTVSVYQGPVITDALYPDNALRAPFPDLPKDVCPFAGTLLVAGPTTVGTWTLGTSLFTATGIVDTWTDLATLPSD